MEAKQAEDESLPQSTKQSSNHPPLLSQSMSNINMKMGGSYNSKSGTTDLLNPGSMFCDERPSSAMSEMSINIHDGDYMSRAESRMEHFGDDISEGILYPGHDKDFSDRVSVKDNFNADKLTSHGLHDNQDSNIQENEDTGIKDEKILRKIEITAVTNKSNEKAQGKEIKKNVNEEKISLIDQSERSMNTFENDVDIIEKSQKD